MDEVYDRWLADYHARGKAVLAELGEVAKRCIALETPQQLVRHQMFSAALVEARASRSQLRHPFCLLLWSRQSYDPDRARDLMVRHSHLVWPDVDPQELFGSRSEDFATRVRSITMALDLIAHLPLIALTPGKAFPPEPLELIPPDPWELSLHAILEPATAVIVEGANPSIRGSGLYDELGYTAKVGLGGRIVVAGGTSLFLVEDPENLKREWPIDRIDEPVAIAARSAPSAFA